MKKHLILIAFLSCVVAVWLTWHGRPPKRTPLNKDTAFLNGPMAGETNATHQQAAYDPESADAVPAGEQRAKQARLRNWNSRSNDFYQAGISSNVPLDFYGKVVDEASNEVAGATVSFIWNKDDMSNPLHSRKNKFTTQSDSVGLFSLQGELGRFLDIRVFKDGYYTPRPEIWSFRYSADTRFLPGTPVIFMLRKKGVGTPLIQRDWPIAMEPSPQLRGDGTPMEVDLLNGQIVPEGKGQLRLALHKNGRADAQANYDWTCSLTIPSGGLLQTVDEFVFEAPESGYQQVISIDMPATTEQWQGEIRNSYFIRLPSGQFGRIDFRLMVYNGVFHLHSAINPSGSRNLEPQNAFQN